MASDILQFAEVEQGLLIDEFNRLVRDGDVAFVVGSEKCDRWEREVGVLRGVLSQFPQHKDWVFSQVDSINNDDSFDFNSLPDDEELFAYLLKVSPAYRIYNDALAKSGDITYPTRGAVAGWVPPTHRGMPGFGELVQTDAA